MNTDLFEVIRRNSIRQVKLVLEAGYDVNARNERMETPLMASVMHVHDPDCRLGVIKLLVSSGADINLQNGRGQTVVMYGCILNQVETVLQLLKYNKLDLNRTDTDGNTALMYSCALGHIDVIGVILDSHQAGLHCVKLHKKNDDGIGALEHAAEGGHFECVKLLSNFGRVTGPTEGSANSVDVDWVDELAPNPNPTPTNHKHQPLNEKVQQFIQEVQDAYTEDSDAIDPEVLLPSPCSGLPSPAVIITGAEQFVRTEPMKPKENTSRRAKDHHKEKRKEHKSQSSVTLRPPSRSKPIRSVARETLDQLSDDEPELTLSSLGELVTTVRECAREIREICQHPGEAGEEKIKKLKKGKGYDKKVKTDATFDLLDDKRRRNCAKDRKGSCPAVGQDESLSHTWPQRSSSSLSVRKSASNTTLNKDGVELRPSSPSVSAPGGEVKDQSLIHEKQILDKVFCRLNNSKIVWGEKSDRLDSKQSANTSNRTSKATMLLRDQFSSYGNPLPGIQRPPACLPPVREGIRLRQLVHSQLEQHVQNYKSRDMCTGSNESEDEDSQGCYYMSV